MTALIDNLRELDRRTSDSIDVQLLWEPATNAVSIAVADERSGEVLHFGIDAADAMNAFLHPFAYALSARASAAGQSPFDLTDQLQA